MASSPAPRPAGVLRPWQRRLYGLLLIPLGLIAANAIYLAAFTRDTAFFYAMLLLHLTLGILIAIPFFVFAVTHARRMIRMWNKRAKYAGLAIFTLAVVCVSTGIFMTFKGATLNNRAVWLGHVLSVPLALVAFILHRRAHTHQLQFRRLYAWGGAVVLFLGAMAVVAKLEKPPRRIVNVNGDTVFFPSSSETFDQGLLDAKKLAANDYCQSCHPDSFHQWERSAHRFSSFNNPFYRKSVELMADRVGRERTKWCSGCHDPVVLFTGQMGAATQAKFSYDSWEAQQGLTCMSCHSIVEVKDVKGNGSYVIEEAKQYPFAFSKNKTLQAVNRLLIRMEPSLHRKTFLKPVHRTPEFCSSCHKVALIPALNSYRWMRGQNHYDTWYDSGVSGRAVRSFYDPPQPKACRDCHLPPYPSQEFGSRKGQLHDHLFPAANTALPFVRGDKEDGRAHPGVPPEQGAHRRHLRDQAGRRAHRARRGARDRHAGRDDRRRGRRAHAGRRAPVHQRHRGLERDLAVARGRGGEGAVLPQRRARRGGAARPGRRHAFPLRHRSRRRPHGPPPTPGHPRPALQQRHRARCRACRALPHDGAARREGTDAALGRRALPEVHARLHDVLARRGVAVAAGDDAGGGSGGAGGVRRANPSPNPLPPGEGAEGNPDPLWLRWNDYGIGLFLQGDFKGAARAWTKTAELAPDKPDGPLNRARAEIAEGRLADAKASLAEAERIRPGWGKTAFFRATVAKEEGTARRRREGLSVRAREVPARPRRLEQPRRSVLWLGRQVP